MNARTLSLGVQSGGPLPQKLFEPHLGGRGAVAIPREQIEVVSVGLVMTDQAQP